MRCYCGAKEYKLLFLANKYKIVQCVFCKQIRTITPSFFRRKQVYDTEDISVYINKEEMFRIIFRRIVDFIKQYKTEGTFFDIGAGVGLLVDEARKAGFCASGIEPSKAAVTAGRKLFGAKLRLGKFSERTILKPTDIVILNHVLEHLSDPPNIIKKVEHALKKDGLLVIGVPNFNSIMSKLKKDRWQNLIPDQHRWHFSIETLDKLVFPFGFVRNGFFMENHDRSMHPLWKRPIYWMLDTFALITNRGEAMLIAYRKV